MDLGLHDRTFVVTGGSGGLGRATAEVLVAEGARVVLSARDPGRLRTTVSLLGNERVTGVPADLSDPATPARLVDAAHAAYGRLDGALVSVGGPPPGGILEVTDAQWEQAFTTVFLGGVRAARTVAEALGDGGALAVVLSTSVKEPLDGLATSNGLRPGLGMALKMLADEVGPRGVRVNGLMPGGVETDRVRQLDAASSDPRATRAGREQRIALRRHGDPAEFGRVAAFLLSPAASYVTGAMVPVDGGMLRSL